MDGLRTRRYDPRRMKRSHATQLAIWSSTTLWALGCAQIAGLTDDYHHVDLDAGAGGQATSGTSGAGRAGAAAGGKGGKGGASGAEAGATGGEAGASGGEAGAGAGSGGSSGGTGGSSGGTAAGAAGMSMAGAGGVVLGPSHVGAAQFHDSASGDQNASSHLTDATFAKPAGTMPGDFMLVFFGCDHELKNMSGTHLALTGWTLIDQQEGYGGDGQGTYLMYKFAGTAEPESIVFQGINDPLPGGNGVQGLLTVYRGVNTAMPINDYQALVFGAGSEGPMQITTNTPDATTTVANSLVIAGLSPDSDIDAPVITAWPDGYTENQVSVNNPAHPYPYGWANIYAAERHVSAIGKVTGSPFHWNIVNSTKYFGAMTFVLSLAPL